MKIIFGIITYNESIHLKRCIESFLKITDKIIVVDSFSDDDTEKIARKYTKNFFKNKFTNFSSQRNFLIDKALMIFGENNYIFFLDADEYIDDELKNALINLKSSSIDKAYLIKRKFIWKGQWIKYGGYYPRSFLRLFRLGADIRSESVINEHLVIKNKNIIVEELQGNIIDHNLNDLNFWIKKHKVYSAFEADAYFDKQRYKSKNLKIYDCLPLFVRVFIYFIYRFFFKCGFLDKYYGLQYHILHSLFYRMYIDLIIMKKIIKKYCYFIKSTKY